MDHELHITLKLPADLRTWLVAQGRNTSRLLNPEIPHVFEVGRGDVPEDDESP
ncbi:hypothetical protein [Streptomyces sp. NPDC048560]|uniref:hypothetical protein n=1 Tax=Streptomyces sp. NPDC048560 TaxID=3155488 RepID=UPI0034145104